MTNPMDDDNWDPWSDPWGGSIPHDDEEDCSTSHEVVSVDAYNNTAGLLFQLYQCIRCKESFWKLILPYE